MNQKGFIQIPILIAIIVGVLVLGGAYVAVKHFSQPTGQLSILTSVEQSPQQNTQSSSISVKSTGSKYKTTSSKPSGWFKTGQDADIALSAIDFNNTGGSLLFNHPGTVASDGTHLLLADRNNNRVLIWNKLPTGNTSPDIVLGQKDFITNNPGTGLDEMNWPVSVSVGGGRVVVTDTHNNRILIWNSFPTRNGQPADLVLEDQVGTEKKRITGPWGVWTNGKKLAVSNTWGAGSVLLWNNFPTENNQPADIYLKGQGAMGTPRTITSDGEHLIVGEHNYNSKPGGSGPPPGSSSGNFFWKSWPTKDDEPYSFFMTDPTDSKAGGWMQGGITSDGKLIMLGRMLYIWNSFPENANDKPDLSVGQSGPSGASAYRFFGGDGAGLAVIGNRLYISLSNGNKIVAFNSMPTKIDDKPDFAIGSPDINTNTLDTNFIMSNPVPVTDGKSLFVSSDFDKKLYVWKNLPDESNAHPDFVYSLPNEPRSNALFGDTLVLAGQKTVIIWKKLPKNGEKPDFILQDSIGNVSFQDLRGVAMDGKYFYLADGQANKIYVWERLPDKNTDPKFVISADSPSQLSSDGSYLVDAIPADKPPGGDVRIYRIDSLSSQSRPISLGGAGKFNRPLSALVSLNHLFLGDYGNNRALIWNNIEGAIAGKNADVILGAENLQDITPEIGRNKLFNPANLTFDGSYLWVGEFKFSERLLRFSVK